MSGARRQVCGFTLVELLVVITIIGILVGMLLPAVQSAREAGRQSTCKNNLHQIGVAAQHHVEAQGYFPCGGWGYMWTGDPDCGFGPPQPGGWIYNLLPYLDQTTMHDTGAGLTGDDKKDALTAMRAVALAGFICPSRRRAIGYPAKEASYNSSQPTELGKTDYAVNGGTWVLLGTADQDCMNAYPNCKGFHDFGSIAKNFNGLSTERSQVSTGEVIDGLSNTYFAGEKYLNPDKYFTGDDGADNNSLCEGYDWDIARWGKVDLPPARDTAGWETTSQRFGSPHVAGFHAVMCDGAVRLILYTIDPQVHEWLANRRDGQAIPADAL